MGKRVLIVDDDNVLTKLIEMELEMKDHDLRVVSAEDGIEAIGFIDRDLPDLILLDLRVPKADGFAVLKHLHDRDHKSPVIVITNYDKEEYREQCREYSIVQEYLLKRSIALHDLVNKVQQYLAVAA